MKNTKRVFQYSTVIPASLQSVIAFHEKRDALKILTPPPLIVQLIEDGRISNTEGTVDFVLWFGPIPVRWIARHEPGPIATSFIDRMMRGPMAEWEHQHIFEEVAAPENNATQQEPAVKLTDRVTFVHYPGWRGWITRVAFDGLALRFLFWYRHWRTVNGCRKLSA